MKADDKYDEMAEQIWDALENEWGSCEVGDVLYECRKLADGAPDPRIRIARAIREAVEAERDRGAAERLWLLACLLERCDE